MDLVQSNDIKILYKNDHYTSFKTSKFFLKESDIIYCNSSYLENLFFYLKNINEFSNITLISGQSDRSINKKLIEKKPNCIKNWYAVNVDFEQKGINSIPLGIANDYSPKNIRIDDFANQNKTEIDKINKLYINIRKSTNLNERSEFKTLFNDKNWVVFKEPNLPIEQYLDDLRTHKFVLCPWGNGIDTHRLWETLYAGSIPVTKYNIAYKSFEKLPIIFVDNYNEITLEFLNSKYSSLNFDNLNLLNFDYWKVKIEGHKNSDLSDKKIIEENNFYENFYFYKLDTLRKLKSKFKVIVYYLRAFKKRAMKLINFF